MLNLAIDSEYDEVTKIPFIVTISDNETSKLLYPDDPKDHWTIQQLCESPDINKIFHSATSDMYALHQVGINVKPPFDDTFIMSSIIDENFSSRKLKDLAKKYLKEKCLEAKELNKIKLKFKKKLGKEFRWSKIPKEIIEPYAIKDAEYTIRLWEYFLPKIKQYQSLYEMELDLVPIILSMMIRGHRIDRDFCRHEVDLLQKTHTDYYNKLIDFNGRVFNLNSPKHLQSLLEKTDINFTEKTPTGRLKMDKEILEPLAKNNDIIQAVINCRQAAKQIDTYYLPLLENYTGETDDIAHFSLYQSGTKTGRFSAELIQTIPKEQSKREVPNKVRRAFIPREGYTNIYMDYDQIEMKLFAHFSKNQNLIEAIRSGMDAHTATALDLFGESAKETFKNDMKSFKELYRRPAKTINFGVIYGMGSTALAASLGLPKREANVILANYDHKYRIKAFINKMTAELYREGHISLDWIGRDYRVPRDLAYKCVNILIQGSAAYVIKLAMIRVRNHLTKKGLWGHGVQMLLQIHDELVFEIHNSLLSRRLVGRIQELMEDHETFALPITASVEYTTTSWLEKKKWKV